MSAPTVREWFAFWLGLAVAEHDHGMPLGWCAVMVVVGVLVSLGTWHACGWLSARLHAFGGTP